MAKYYMTVDAARLRRLTLKAVVASISVKRNFYL